MAFKMKGSPMQRNFGIGVSPIKQYPGEPGFKKHGKTGGYSSFDTQYQETEMPYDLSIDPQYLRQSDLPFDPLATDYKRSQQLNYIQNAPESKATTPAEITARAGLISYGAYVTAKGKGPVNDAIKSFKSNISKKPSSNRVFSVDKSKSTKVVSSTKKFKVGKFIWKKGKKYLMPGAGQGRLIYEGGKFIYDWWDTGSIRGAANRWLYD